MHLGQNSGKSSSTVCSRIIVRVLLPHFGHRIQSVFAFCGVLLVAFFQLSLPDLFIQLRGGVEALPEVDQMPQNLRSQNKRAVDHAIQRIVPKAPAMGEWKQYRFQESRVQDGAEPPRPVCQFFTGSIYDERGHAHQRQQDAAAKKADDRQLTGGVEQQAHEKGAEHDKAVDKHKPMQPEFDFFHTLLLIAPAAVSGH